MTLPVSTAALVLLACTTVLWAADDVPTGTVIKGRFAQSQIFPGTVRDYWVYIPRQHDGVTPACVYVNQDGLGWNAPKVFDRLIAAKQIPVCVGIFVNPGVVPAVHGQALERFNRSVEYDGMGDGYAQFLLDELIPYVAKTHQLTLSSVGNDRAIGGGSSGAICAFTAAWQRPDAFSRVFSAIGSYVGLRGGNMYPTLIRWHEPKPLRVFLQDGSNDQLIYGGDWWMANQEMQRALQFAGYEVHNVWGTGGHDGKQATEVFADAMTWLWKEWPKPVAAGRGSPQMQEVLIPGEGWQVVTKGLSGANGVLVNADGQVEFVDGTGDAYRFTPDSALERLPPVPGIITQRLGPDGRIYQAMDNRQIVAVDAAGTRTVIADGLAVTDLALHHTGSIYVTEQPPAEKGRVWLIPSSGEKRVVMSGIPAVSGLTISPDQTLLYVADASNRWVWSSQILKDGSLINSQEYYHLAIPDGSATPGTRGMCVDVAGRLYVATQIGIQFCDQAGRVNGIIPVPSGRVTSLAITPTSPAYLIAACGDVLYRRKISPRGTEGSRAPIKPDKPRL